MADLNLTDGTARLIGYVRVSTVAQETALQTAAMERAGVARVFEEKLSAVVRRPQLEALLAELQPGDVVVVYKVDRLARSLAQLLEVLERIDAAGATFRSLTEPIETRTPIGRLFLQLLGSFAEFERALIRERCAAGRVEAKARGQRFGPPRRHSWETIAELRGRGLSWAAVGAAVGCEPSTARRAFARYAGGAA